ncbi:hypothetical protein ACFOWA_13225 [Pedobacter lithocola]|uniref:Uncharacterized protein n=1 Tax=Pedobacter lithocola TaxID=1908239 RepID=A0ABV8PC04_9SPHI
MLEQSINTNIFSNEEKESLSTAGDILTEKPSLIEVTIKPKNLVQHFLITIRCITNKRVFVLRPLLVGNMFRIASKVVLIPSNFLEQNLTTAIMVGANQHLSKLVYCVACALQNDHREPTNRLIKLIENEFTLSDLCQIFDGILLQINTKDFMEIYHLAERPKCDKCTGRGCIKCNHTGFAKDEPKDKGDNSPWRMTGSYRKYFKVSQQELLWQTSWANFTLDTASIPVYEKKSSEDDDIVSPEDEERELRELLES